MSSDNRYKKNPQGHGEGQQVEQQAEVGGQSAAMAQSPADIRIVYRVSCQCALGGLSDQGHTLEYVMSLVPGRHIDVDKFDRMVRDYLEDSRAVPEDFDHTHIHEVFKAEVTAGIVKSLRDLGCVSERIEVMDIPGQGESPGDDWDDYMSGSDGSDGEVESVEGEERNGEERKGEERKGEERQGEEREGEEREGEEREGGDREGGTGKGEDGEDGDDGIDREGAHKEGSKRIEEAQRWFLEQWNNNRGRIIPNVPFRLVFNFLGVPDLYLVEGEAAAQTRIEGGFGAKAEDDDVIALDLAQ
ncbi:hypothetical protein DB88DRAFT_548078 [Papiliotrema laurentii]|uniref:Uncharacterized protein n=1 Tax=Papiliotrema laurentii TaxID=5418 RepID=A0AAD9CW49_PAPLA|nr:hypothetical protein DB88DRAFT_548078 [Papiliotrema laurentii]